MKRWHLGVVLIVALGTADHAAAAPELRVGPVLGCVRPDSITVVVGLDAPAAIEVDASSPRGAEARVLDGAKAWHEVTLRGLTPDTAYDYAVRVEGREVARSSFVTAPPDGADVPVRFLVYGDTRDDPAAHASVARAMARESSAFVLHTGDLVADGRAEDAWQDFFDAGHTLFASQPLFATLGNHEMIDGEGAGLAHYRRWLSLPGNERYYRVEYGPLRVLVLDSNTDLTAGSPQRRWLDDELAAARRDRPQHLFALLHAGPLSSGYHGENPALRDNDVESALRAAHVELIFEGHDHAYERGELRGLKYVLTGGGGAPLYPVNDQRPYQLAFLPEHHYVRVDVRGPTVRVVARTDAGVVLDACSYARGAPWRCVGGRGGGRGRVVTGRRAWPFGRGLWALAAVGGAGVTAWWSRRRRR